MRVMRMKNREGGQISGGKEGEGGAVVKGDQGGKRGYFSEFFHKYVRFVRSKAFFERDLGADSSETGCASVQAGNAGGALTGRASPGCILGGDLK